MQRGEGRAGDEKITHRNLGDLWHELALDSPAKKSHNSARPDTEISPRWGHTEMRPKGGAGQGSQAQPETSLSGIGHPT